MYRRIRLLGAGFFGKVWLEHDEALDRPVAAKCIRVREGDGLELLAEGRWMLQAKHPNVVEVLSAEIEDDYAVIRMEYLPNGSVRDAFGEQPLPVIRAIRAVEDACRGLERLHSGNLLHRDLKPSNLMMAPDGTIKVSDFGLTCSLDEENPPPLGYTLHLPPESVPLPGYVESVSGDIYALGVTLLRLVAGDAVLSDARNLSEGEMLAAIANGSLLPRVLPDHIHEGLRRVIRTATHLNAEKRFSSAAEMRHALERARPRVSWQVIGGGPVLRWEGESQDGKTVWRAALTRTRKGHSFRLERARPGHRSKTVRAASKDGVDASSEILAHARRVLQTVAVKGKFDP